jgi:uncharacterized GH25 family protein
MNYKISFFILVIAIILIACCIGGISHTVSFMVTTPGGDPIKGAIVTAIYNTTTSSGNTVGPTNNLITGTQTGTTDSSGTVVFSMVGSAQYDVIVAYQGNQTMYQIYPADSLYILRVNNAT